MLGIFGVDIPDDVDDKLWRWLFHPMVGGRTLRSQFGEFFCARDNVEIQDIWP
jgi:hypothetical protein